MEKRILFQPEDASVAIVTPCECGLSIREIGLKDVPKGLPFWIVNKSEVDSLYENFGDYRSAWKISESSIGRAPDGIGGA